MFQPEAENGLGWEVDVGVGVYSRVSVCYRRAVSHPLTLDIFEELTAHILSNL